MFVKIVAFSCLVAVVSCANGPRRSHILPSDSQVVPQSVNAPNSAADQAAKLAAQQAKLHYVEIGPSLKGDYKFGYDTGSGPAGQSFREETRLDDGTVKGAYGYVDANGKQRIVKYTAGKNGFVVEGDQEAPGQGGAGAAQPAPAQAQPEAPRRPQPVSLPQAAQPTFDEQPATFSRTSGQAAAQTSAEDRARAEAQHAEQLRQHQLAQQAALAQQQRLAQQLQLQQQQIVAQQASVRQHQQQQPQHAPQQFGQLPQQAPQPSVHQTADPQNGQFFSSSSDSNLNQLLSNQLRQLQSGNQFGGQFQPPQAFRPQPQQQHQAQHFAAQASPAFQQPAAQFAAPQQPHHHNLQQQNQPQQAGFDFAGTQFRGARQAGVQQHFPQQPVAQPATPQSALLALHQQQQHDAQLLANLRAQQLRQTAAAPAQAAQQQQQFQQPQQAQPVEIPQQAQVSPRFAPSQQAAPANQPTPQPESFGPPVIDIRTLNYSIGQQTQVN